MYTAVTLRCPIRSVGKNSGTGLKLWLGLEVFLSLSLLNYLYPISASMFCSKSASRSMNRCSYCDESIVIFLAGIGVAE